eukprot:Gb_03659 [translate_table: standard]
MSPPTVVLIPTKDRGKKQPPCDWKEDASSARKALVELIRSPNDYDFAKTDPSFTLYNERILITKKFKIFYLADHPRVIHSSQLYTGESVGYTNFIVKSSTFQQLGAIEDPLERALEKSGSNSRQATKVTENMSLEPSGLQALGAWDKTCQLYQNIDGGPRGGTPSVGEEVIKPTVNITIERNLGSKNYVLSMILGGIDVGIGVSRCTELEDRRIAYGGNPDVLMTDWEVMLQ